MPPGEFRGVPVTSILGVSLGNACLKPDGWAAYMVIHGRGSPRVVIRSLSLTPHYQSLFGPCDVTHWRSWTRFTIGACCFTWVLADLSRPRYSEVGRVYPLINLLVRHRIDSRRTEVSNINWANGSWMVKADYHLKTLCLNKHTYTYHPLPLIKHRSKFECAYIKINHLHSFTNDITMLTYM